MAQNRDRNWQDRDQQQRGGGWQGGEDFGQGGGSWNDEREHGSQQSGWQGGGYGQQQGSEWNRMGRYGEEGWQGGGQGRFSQGGNYRMDRDYGQQQGGRGGFGGTSGWQGGGANRENMNRPYVGESSFGGSRGSWGQSNTAYGAMGDGAGGYGSRGGYGTGSYGSGTYGTGSGSGYGSGHGYGASGYGQGGFGSSYGQQGGGQDRGLWDRATDEVSSWFGDDSARRRREMDEHRGRGPRGYTRSDERIKEDVNDRLTDDGWLDASDIEVEVSTSEVTLTGQVNSREEKRRAEDIAEAISGVKHVQNNLRVKDRNGGHETGTQSSNTSATGAITTSPAGTGATKR